MLRKASKNEYCYLLSQIKKDIFQNVYLYIDSIEYGFEEENVIETFIVSENNKVVAIVYKYYNSIQLFSISQASEQSLKDIANFIIENNIHMASGNLSISSDLMKYMPKNYKIFEGCLLTGENIDNDISTEIIQAKKEDIHEIAELICSDNDIGGHYSVDMLFEQLVDRMENHHCRDLIIRNNKKIVSHMATYAELDNIAVMGGLITSSEFRNQGFGSKILTGLAKTLNSENKTPVIFCYKEDLIDWYVKKGWTINSRCAKIELVDN